MLAPLLALLLINLQDPELAADAANWQFQKIDGPEE